MKYILIILVLLGTIGCNFSNKNKENCQNNCKLINAKVFIINGYNELCFCSSGQTITRDN